MSMKERLSYRKTAHPQTSEGWQGWEESVVNDTLNVYDNSEMRTPTLILENHPNDSRVKIREDNVFQTLSSRMGTGGNNVPMVMEKQPILLENNQNHATIQTDGVSTTLPASMGMGGWIYTYDYRWRRKDGFYSSKTFNTYGV